MVCAGARGLRIGGAARGTHAIRVLTLRSSLELLPFYPVYPVEMTGNPLARQFGNPDSSRRARYPCLVRSVTA